MKTILAILNAITLAIVMLVPLQAQAAPGSLDTSFGTGGKVITNFSGRNDMATALAIQPDGKILAAGITTDPTLFDLNFALWRYNADGTPDNTFGTGGFVTTDFAGGHDQGFAIALQADNKIVVAGVAGNLDFAVARYNPDGTLDTTFGAGAGKVVTDIFGAATYDAAHAVVLQPDGKILVAGEAVNPGVSSDFALVRYNADGTLDTTFGPAATGIVTTDVLGAASSEFGFALSLQPDGKIIVAGDALAAATATDFALVRYNSNGTLDTTFGTAGVVSTDVGGISMDDLLGGMALQSDGRILLAGTSTVAGGNSDFALMRYNANGTLDTTFGGGTGMVFTDVSGTAAPNTAHAVVLQSNGEIVVAGTATNSALLTNEFALARYHSDGTLDTGFGTAGLVKTAMHGESDTVLALALQADGKIVAAGESWIVPTLTYRDFAMARYQGTPAVLLASSGGCLLGAQTGFDPFLPLLMLLLALGVLFRSRSGARIRKE